jgi:hypothetical protein
MLALVQRHSPSPKPFLMGASYAVIPELLVPRFLNPDKPRSLQGQYILCVYYGLQTWATVKKTGIGFGLPAEAYANFGYFGLAGLAILEGLLHGWVTRASYGAPAMSLRSFIAFLFLGLAMNLECSMAVFVTSLLQGIFTLLVGTWVLMRTVPAEDRLAAPAEEYYTKDWTQEQGEMAPAEVG